MELNVTSFFSFTTYLTGLAFLIMAWTNVEYKYRQRLYMSWLSKKGMLITVTVVGVLTLASDFVIAQKIAIPYSPCIQHIWQLALAATFLFLVLYWIIVGFMAPPRFNKHNCEELENDLLLALEYGREDITQGTIDFLGRSMKEIVKAAPQDIDNSQTLSIEQSCARNIIGLMGNDYFCKSVVKMSPGVAIELFREMSEQKKYSIGASFFAEHFITQALADENSFIYRETKLGNGILSWDRPFLSNVYTNAWLVQNVPSLLEPNYSLTSTWNHRQAEAYGEALLLAIRAFIKAGCGNHYIFRRPLEIMVCSADRIRNINGLDSGLFDNEDKRVYSAVLNFYKELMRLVGDEEKRFEVHKSHSKREYDQNLIEMIADSIVDLMFATSSLKTPLEVCRSVKEIEFYFSLFVDRSEEDKHGVLNRQVCRSLLKTFQDNMGVKGVNVLIFCLDCFGLKRRNDTPKSVQLLNRFTIQYARHHLMAMFEKASKIKTMKLPDGIEMDVERKTLTKKFVEDVYGRSSEETLKLL